MQKIYKLYDNIFYVHQTVYGLKINGITVKDRSSFSSIDTVQKHSSNTTKVIIFDGKEITQSQLDEMESDFYSLIEDYEEEETVKAYKYKGAKEDYEQFKKENRC